MTLWTPVLTSLPRVSQRYTTIHDRVSALCKRRLVAGPASCAQLWSAVRLGYVRKGGLVVNIADVSVTSVGSCSISLDLAGNVKENTE
jgi:hypothetical protein